MSGKCAVIGSGIAGLATAIRLKAMGWEVAVFERNNQFGGKINDLKINDFRFDIGPTVLTMPWLIDELFEIHGKDPRAYFNYDRIKKPTKYFFEDGTRISAHRDTGEYATELEKTISLPKSRFNRFLRDARTKFNLTQDVFLKSSLHRIENYTRWKAVKGIFLFSRVGAFTTMARWNRKLFRNDHAERVINRYAEYVGSDPYKISSTFNVISHIELEKGVFHVEGGMRNVIHALVKLCTEIGVEMHTNSKVERILVYKNKVSGIRLEKREMDYDIVVSNADIHFTKNELMGIRKESNVRKLSSSAVLFCWCMQGGFPEFGAHNFIFGDDCKKEFTSIFDECKIPDNGAIYLHISSRLNENDAPADCENWFVMMNMPPDSGQDWEGKIHKIRRDVIRRLSELSGKDIESKIRHERMISPPQIGELYRSYRGAIYGNNSNTIWSAFLRHPNFLTKVKGLYFAGGSVHPGAGIPLCLYSAEITAKLIEKREKP